MEYLKVNEIVADSFILYWARTRDEWYALHENREYAFKDARRKYNELLDKYSAAVFEAARNPGVLSQSYRNGYEQGGRIRSRLQNDGLSLETFENNNYSGTSFLGLYGYMDAMEGKPSRY